MFRTLLLASIAPLVIACQSTQTANTTATPDAMSPESVAAPAEEQIVSPTDGIYTEPSIN